MANTKIPVELSSTPSIVDNGNATAITIDSSENVGIGGSTITDSNLLNLQGSSASVNIGVVFNDTNTSKIFGIQNGGSALKFFDYTASTERMRIDSSGNVSIGNTVVSSMDAGANNLVVGTGSGTEGMTIYSGTANSGVIYFADGASGDDRFRGQIGYSHSDDAFSFRTNASSSANMTIDSLGNLLVGNTDSTPYDRTTGNAIALGDGLISSAQEGGNAAIFNRMTSDGSIVNFRKNGTSVGSIGTVSFILGVGSGDTLLGFDAGLNAIYPMSTQTGGGSNGVIDLGYQTRNFKDLYLSGGAYIGGTGSANHLDDYEEGTWTPQLSNGTSMGSNSATYTKIGNLVTVRFDLTNNSGSDTDRIYGLPFNTVGHGSFHITWNNIGNTNYIGAYSNNGDMQLIQSGTTSSWTLPNGNRILGFGIYYTSL